MYFCKGEWDACLFLAVEEHVENMLEIHERVGSLHQYTIHRLNFYRCEQALVDQCKDRFKYAKNVGNGKIWYQEPNLRLLVHISM